ncbi:tetratricopeptide repeat protein [Flavobacterium panacagri]|uniref:tetratricopeptide repeat protein n=1 Tax=Flavobacterium panacagri TaxID=3034146 RepID=UPI0025A526AB|nr:hypothetical protein [Flavobacterium panacagri]
MMKNYRSYQKVEPVYFSGEIFFPVGLLFAASLITYGLLYFTGFWPALFFNVVIAWCGYFYMYYFGRSNSKITFEFISGVFLIIALLLFVDYGVYVLVQYQKTRIFSRLYFTVWLAILIGVPISYYTYYFGSHYYKKVSLADRYFKTYFSIYHDRELLMHIDSVAFVNPFKTLISDIKIENNNCFYSDEELAEMDRASKYYYLQKSAFSGLIHIPFGADQFEISWFSFVEDKQYKVNVPFPIEELKLEEEKYPLDEPKNIRGKKSKRIYLHIYQKGAFKLYTEDQVLLDFISSESMEIDQEEKKEKVITNIYSHKYYNNKKRFFELLESIKNSNAIEERFKLKDKQVVWNLELSGLDQRHYLEILGADFKTIKIEKEEFSQIFLRSLPKRMTFVFRGSYLFPWLTLHIDIQKLNQCIEELTSYNSENAITFSLDFKSLGADLAFYVFGNKKKVLFTDWEMVIDENRKKEMDEEILEKQEDETKRRLLNEGWDFVFSKNYKGAQKKCEELLALDSSYGFAYFLEARLLWYTEGFEACYSKRNYFFAKTEHEPAALAHLYNSFGCILDLELCYEESLQYFEKAIEINPKEPIYVCNLGEMYYKLLEPVKALNLAKRAKSMGYESDMLTEILNNKGKIDLINH